MSLQQSRQCRCCRLGLRQRLVNVSILNLKIFRCLWSLCRCQYCLNFLIWQRICRSREAYFEMNLRKKRVSVIRLNISGSRGLSAIRRRDVLVSLESIYFTVSGPRGTVSQTLPTYSTHYTDSSHTQINRSSLLWKTSPVVNSTSSKWISSYQRTTL